MATIFDQYQTEEKKSSNNIFDQYQEEPESFWKETARTALQIPQGVAEATTYGISTGLWNLFGHGEVFDPEEIEHIRQVSERHGVPFDEEAYMRAGQEALGILPTISNIGREVEERTGLPLEPKTKVQKGLRFASMFGKAIPKSSPQAPGGYTFRGVNTGLPRPVLGVGGAAAREGIIQAGVPEPLADLASFLVVKPTTQGASSLNIGKSTKPSGMTERRYETLESPKEVKQSTINKINDKTEKEFREITNQIIEKSPIKETYERLGKDITFKTEASEAFQKVEDLAGSIPRSFPTSILKNDLKKSITHNQGITALEFDKHKNKFLEELISNTRDAPFSTQELVKQYRKNNKAMRQMYEPGQSFAYNRAKREAVLEYNQIIGSMIEKAFPGTEFAKLFRESNLKWREIMDSEAINKFMDKIFTGKTDFKQAKKLFENEGMDIPFKRSLGEEGYNRFQTLVQDLLSTEKGNKMLHVAQKNGFGDFAKLAGSYIMHPKIGALKAGVNATKSIYKSIYEMLLDKPKVAVTWQKGLNAAKKGDFKTAQTAFEKVDSAEKARVEALKNFNQRSKQAKSRDETIDVAAEEINAKAPPKMSPKETAAKAFDTYGLTSFLEDAVNNGFISKLEDVAPYIRNSSMLLRKAEAMEAELGKSLEEIISDIYGNPVPPKAKAESPKQSSQASSPPEKKSQTSNKPATQKRIETSATPKQIERKEIKKPSVKAPKKQDVLESELSKILPKRRKFTKEDELALFGEKKPKTSKINKAKLAAEKAKKERGKSVDEVIEILDKRKSEAPAAARTAHDIVKELREVEKSKKGNKFGKIRDLQKEIADLEKKSAETQTSIKPAKKSDFSPSGLREQKDFILKTLEDAIANPQKGEKVTIQVPNDGVFKIWNIDEILKDFMKKVKKDWPVQQTKRKSVTK